MADLLAALETTSGLTEFAALVRGAGIEAVLREPGPRTLFAPIDAAFTRLDAAMLAALRSDAARARALLDDHLAPGALVAADLMDVPSLTMLSGRSLAIDVSLGIRLDHAYLVEADALTSNGVLHLIDGVLLPAAAPPER